MYKVKSEDSFNIKGRGKVFTFPNPIPHHVKRDDLKKELGELMEIDGTVYKIKDVESFAVCPQRPGIGIGVLVEKKGE